jgi:hypothetical protein
MLPWKERPIEIANLLNPAFGSLLLCDCINSFQENVPLGMPFALSFLILPVVLHKSTRESLPKTTRTKLHVWLQEKPQVRIGFAQRTQELAPYSREGLLFGLQSGNIAVDNGKLLIIQRPNDNKSWSEKEEPAVCREKARFVGRWFALSGSLSSIFVMWGIRL